VVPPPLANLEQTISQEELFAIYNVADVCMVTSVRDGMNLVSHEYVAAQHKEVLLPDAPGIPVRSGSS
jgi:trehalose-6-phosphate synthase